MAAPTAGLHFDDALMAGLRQRGIAMAELTLHVAAGTFQPMRVDKLIDHTMHSEFIDVPQAVVDAVAAARSRGGTRSGSGNHRSEITRIRGAKRVSRPLSWRQRYFFCTLASHFAWSMR